ncbi:hypothetical protein U9M48_022842 [Paspalum notatum var. saurae]|uniref:GRF-type domain-containing protein n=1 Tax=Paspalum notatum var. saurae TaxID=547442 RepID=A0AAQ3TII2_PASNO
MDEVSTLSLRNDHVPIKINVRRKKGVSNSDPTLAHKESDGKMEAASIVSYQRRRRGQTGSEHRLSSGGLGAIQLSMLIAASKGHCQESGNQMQRKNNLRRVFCPNCGVLANRNWTRIDINGNAAGRVFYKCPYFAAGGCQFYQWEGMMPGVEAVGPVVSQAPDAALIPQHAGTVAGVAAADSIVV